MQGFRIVDQPGGFALILACGEILQRILRCQLPKRLADQRGLVVTVDFYGPRVGVQDGEVWIAQQEEVIRSRFFGGEI